MRDESEERSALYNDFQSLKKENVGKGTEKREIGGTIRMRNIIICENLIPTVEQSFVVPLLTPHNFTPTLFNLLVVAHCDVHFFLQCFKCTGWSTNNDFFSVWYY